jgi:hypothetical protein
MALPRVTIVYTPGAHYLDVLLIEGRSHTFTFSQLGPCLTRRKNQVSPLEKVNQSKMDKQQGVNIPLATH